VTEGGLVHTPLSTALSRRRSRNVVATIEPAEAPARTLCLSCHLDTSRSGLMFQPGVVEHLNGIISAQAAAVLAQAAEALLVRRRLGRGALAAARAVVAAGLGLLVERELRGGDVPGASDNASGAAVVAELAAECASRPPASTRVVVLMTGCEESGLLGAQAFLASRDTAGWLFVNFDNLGGPATLRFLRREGVLTKWDADAKLVDAAERLRLRRPELRLEPTDTPAGLTYDSSPVLARGGRAITFSAQDETIPNLHLLTDTVENLDPEVLGRALEAGREMIAAIDRGEAD
ncbi:MAG TPA: M28 family peptidase, partial [Solirubrobacterales bacterium]|nr:M28 family peptidase [Solirubrobacterales bacterium]